MPSDVFCSLFCTFYVSAGVLLMAKSKAAAAGVHAQFRERTVEKTYLAITCGVPDRAEFLVDAPVDRHPSIKCASLGPWLLSLSSPFLAGALKSGACSLRETAVYSMGALNDL